MGGGWGYLVLVGVGQGLGGLRAVGQLDEEAQRVALGVARGVVLAHGLVEAGPLLAAPGVAELIVAQGRLQVTCG